MLEKATNPQAPPPSAITNACGEMASCYEALQAFNREISDIESLLENRRAQRRDLAASLAQMSGEIHQEVIGRAGPHLAPDVTTQNGLVGGSFGRSNTNR